MAVRDRLLGTRRGYAAFRRLIRADRSMKVIADTYVRAPEGGRVLDVGCGPGDLARFLDGVEYVGVDHNASYVNPRGSDEGTVDRRLIEANIEELDQLDIGEFDVIVMLGVLHHLDEATALGVCQAASRLLRPQGRLVTVDPAFDPQQRSIARILMAMDRGRYVRHPWDYERIVRSSLENLVMTVRHDLNPFPYSHCIVEGQNS